MKRVLPLALLLLPACSGSPPAAAPAVHSTAPVKPAEKTDTGRWIELSDAGKSTLLVGRGADGAKKYQVELRPVVGALGTPDGGAFVVVQEETRYSPGRADTFRTVMRIDATGHIEWKTLLKGGSWDFRLFVEKDRLIAFDLVHQNFDRGAHLFVLDVATGAPQWDGALPDRTRDAAAGGGVLAFTDDESVARIDPGGKIVWRARLRMYPALRSGPGNLRKARRVAVAADGTVLTGAPDGSLVAFDASGKALYQLGVRGSVIGIDARPDNTFAVRTKAGTTTIIGPGGTVLRELLTFADQASYRQRRLADVRKPGGMDKLPPSRTAVPFRPTAAYRAQKQEATRRVLSVAAAAPDDVWVLGLPPVSPQSDNFDVRLFHHDGRSLTDLGAPTVSLAEEVLAKRGEVPAKRGSPVKPGFVPRRLALGPKGVLMVLGFREYPSFKRPCLLERTKNGFQERREVFETLSDVGTGWGTIPTYAASPNGREVYCDGDPRVCMELGTGVATRRLEESGIETIEGIADEVVGDYGISGTPLLFEGESPRRSLGFSGGSDIWGTSGAVLVRWDGKTATRYDAPARFQSVWASARDDVWLGGAEGVGHFDGERFHQLMGVPKPSSGEQSVIGTTRGDVWVYGVDGLWHVTPDPDAGPEIEGVSAAAPPAAPPGAPLAIQSADPSYHLEKVVIDVDGQRPLQRAIHVAAAPDGTLWFHEGARIVEYDGSKARVLYQSPSAAPFYCWYAPEPDCNLCVECTDRQPHVLACERCGAPAGTGQGVFLTPDQLFSVKGGRAGAGSSPLSSVTAVLAGPSGSFWAVSASDDELPHAVHWSAKGKQVVLGLPPAAYTDLSARDDGEAWFAGGLTSIDEDGLAAIAGEGTLVGFDGKSFTRYRAPRGALLSVAVASPGEAWAVGLGGAVIHVKGGKSSAFFLASEGEKDEPAPVLRSVSASSSEDVWIAGDGASLLRWDGHAFHRIDASIAGKTVALSSVLAPGAKAGWVVGPSGIFKIVKK